MYLVAVQTKVNLHTPVLLCNVVNNVVTTYIYVLNYLTTFCPIVYFFPRLAHHCSVRDESQGYVRIGICLQCTCRSSILLSQLPRFAREGPAHTHTKICVARSAANNRLRRCPLTLWPHHSYGPHFCSVYIIA